MSQHVARSTLLLALVTLSALAVGCRKPRERAFTKEQERAVDAAVSATRPEVARPLDVTFREGVRLVAAEVDLAAVRPGDSVEVTWTWEALADLEGGWKVFVHLEGPGRRVTADHHPVGELLPMGRWRAGQFIRYTQTIALPIDFPAGEAVLWAGIFDEAAWADRQENRRMTPEGTASAAVDAEGRVELLKLRVSPEAAPAPARPGQPTPPPRPEAVAWRATAPVTLDGVLDEPVWRASPVSAPFTSPDGGRLPADRATTAQVAWDATHLHVAFTVLDDRVENPHRGRDATLWKADVVEIYLDPGGRGENYYELQISPEGELFDALFTSRRTPEWPEAAANLTMAGLRAGIARNPAGWTVEVSVPWADMPTVGAAPSTDASWGFNLYRIDERVMAAWSPAGGDFHNTAAFGRLRLRDAPPPGLAAEPSQATPAAATPAPAASGATPSPAPPAASPATATPPSGAKP
jgi:hypothetical protein